MADAAPARVQASATTILAVVATVTLIVGGAFWAGSLQGGSDGTTQLLQSEIEDEAHQRQAADLDFQHQLQALKDAFTDHRETNTAANVAHGASLQQVLVAIERLTVQVETFHTVNTTFSDKIEANAAAIAEIRALVPASAGSAR